MSTITCKGCDPKQSVHKLIRTYLHSKLTFIASLGRGEAALHKLLQEAGGTQLLHDDERTRRCRPCPGRLLPLCKRVESLHRDAWTCTPMACPFIGARACSTKGVPAVRVRSGNLRSDLRMIAGMESVLCMELLADTLGIGIAAASHVTVQYIQFQMADI